ncbi:MAG TPA: SusD/RagB family nutrient-binding outer membrane lipoprotein, partial [Chitinophagaceae bacterium]
EFWFLDWWMGHGARSGSYQSLNEEETYKFTNDFHVGIWNQLYANANNYNLMVNKAKELGSGTYEAIGRIMKSHNFQMLTDIYGNIPYSEAFKGTEVPTPKYDKAVDVYKGIFADLDAAIVLLEDAVATDPAKNPDIAVADLVFQGNTTMWIQFANTLRLRMLVHLYNGMATQTVAPGIDVAAQVAKITANGAGFLGAGQSAHLNPGFTGTKPNPYYRFYHTNEAGSSSQRDHLRASEYAIDYYAWDGDPRASRFYVAPAGGHKGIPFGTPAGVGVPTGDQLSNIRGTGLIPNGAASRAWILTSVESLFLQAEARQRGILTTGSTAQALMTAAVQESFVWLKVGTTDALSITAANTYMTANGGYPDVDYTAPSLGAGLPPGGLFTILSQKWFALNMIAPYELWADWRRTGVVYGAGGLFDPGPTISVDPNAGTVIPVRLFYPQNEYNYNAANVAAEGTINVYTGRVFWDLN